MDHKNQNQQFEEIEEKLRQKNQAKKLSKHKMKVSGKSVFKLEKIIKDRSHESKS